MVFLVESSAISQQQFPFIFEWDSFVRKHYNYYQKLINAQSYQLQRIQRYLFVIPSTITGTPLSHLLQPRRRQPQPPREEAASW